MSQADLFSESAPAKPIYRPEPDKVRRRLERILAEAKGAETLPWSPAQARLYRTIVPNMTRWLPEAEGQRWRDEFDAELTRLEAA